MSKAQMTAFLAKAAADPSLQAQVNAASGPIAVVAIAHGEGFVFSPAQLSRHLRG